MLCNPADSQENTSPWHFLLRFLTHTDSCSTFMSSGTLLSSPEVETRGTRTRGFGPVNTRAHVKLGSGRRREEIPVQDTAQLSLPLPVSPCLSVRMTERSGVYTCPVSRIHYNDTSRLLPPISKTAHATFRFLLTSQSRQQRRRK